MLASSDTDSNPRQSRGLTNVTEIAADFLPWVWIVGAPVTFLLLATGVVGAERLRRESRLEVDGPVVECLERLRASLRIGRRVSIAVCERVAAPVLVGIVWPMILLPPAALTGWSPDELEMVLLHELAHVRRWDNLVNLVQRVVEALLFFQPAVWLVSGWVRREREACCDAVVVGATQRPQAYAELLVALASQLPRSVLFHPAAASAMAAGPLRGRIRRILGMEDDPMLISGKSLGVVMSSLLLAATLVVLNLPARSEAEQQTELTTEGTEKKTENNSGAAEVDSVDDFFSDNLPFVVGASRFADGDQITIASVTGPTKSFLPGGTYWIEGTYALGSRDSATLMASVTAKNAADRTGAKKPALTQDIRRGSGTFSLKVHMTGAGWPHVSFYPSDGGQSFGGVYFGTGDSVLTKWWHEQERTTENTEGTDRNSALEGENLSSEAIHAKFVPGEGNELETKHYIVADAARTRAELGTISAIVSADTSQPRAEFRGSSFGGTGLKVVAPHAGQQLIKATIDKINHDKWRVETTNKLKDMMLGVLGYEAAKQHLPPRAKFDIRGKPLLSWRVMILPYLEPAYAKLYEEFHLDEPWDSEHNRQLIARMPDVFRNPQIDRRGMTNYLAVVGEECAFDPNGKPITLRQVSDGTANTIAIVEADADRAVEWTRPDDWEFDRASPTAGLGGLWRNGWCAAWLDSHMRWVSNEESPEQVGINFTRNGREVSTLSESAGPRALGGMGMEGGTEAVAAQSTESVPTREGQTEFTTENTEGTEEKSEAKSPTAGLEESLEKKISFCVALFNAPGHSRNLKELYDRFSQEGRTIYLYGFEVDPESAAGKRYRLTAAPTCIVFRDGKETARLDGIESKEQLVGFVEAKSPKKEPLASVERNQNDDWPRGVVFPSPKEGEISRRAKELLGVKIVPASQDELRAARQKGFDAALKILDPIAKGPVADAPIILVSLNGVVIKDYDVLAQMLGEISNRRMNAGLTSVKVGGVVDEREFVSTIELPPLDSVEIRAGNLGDSMTFAGGHDAKTSAGDLGEYVVAPLSQPAGTDSKRFPTLEEQKLADLVYRRLGLELEVLNESELQQVQALGYEGGMKVAQNDGTVIRWDGSPNSIQANDILVGLHVWPTRSAKEVLAVLEREDLAELNPLKYYVVRRTQAAAFGNEPSPPPRDDVVTGRISLKTPARQPARRSSAVRVDPPQPLPPAPQQVNAEEIAALQQHVEILERQFKKVDEQYRSGAKHVGPMRDMTEYELALSQGDLLLAKGSREKAIERLKEAGKAAENALQSVTREYEANRVTQDVLLQAARNVTNVKLKLSQVEQAAASAVPPVMPQPSNAFAAPAAVAPAQSVGSAPQPAAGLPVPAIPNAGALVAPNVELTQSPRSGSTRRQVHDVDLIPIVPLSDTEKEELVRQGPLRLQFYYSPDSGPCKRAEELVEEYEKAFPKLFEVERINVLEEPAIATGNQILHLPTMMFYQGDRRIHRVTGAMDLAALTEFITRFARRQQQERVELSPKPGLRYDGKTFDEWRTEWQTELSTAKRIEAVKALAAFGANGYGKEAATAIVEVAGNYDFTSIGNSLEDKIKKDCISSLGGQLLGSETPHRISAEEALPALLKAAESSNSNSRLLALWVLPEYMSESQQAAEALAKLTDDQNAIVRSRALEVSTPISAQQEEPAIFGISPRVQQDFLSDDPETVRKAIRSLVKDADWFRNQGMPVEQDGPLLCLTGGFFPLLFSRDEIVRKEARQALQFLNDSDRGVVRQLEGILNLDVRRKDHLETIRALAALGPKARPAMDRLKQLLASDDPQIRIAAAAAIKMIVGKDQYQKPVADVLGEELGIEAAKTTEGAWGVVPRENMKDDGKAFNDFTEAVIKEQEQLFPDGKF